MFQRRLLLFLIAVLLSSGIVYLCLRHAAQRRNELVHLGMPSMIHLESRGLQVLLPPGWFQIPSAPFDLSFVKYVDGANATSVHITRHRPLPGGEMVAAKNSLNDYIRKNPKMTVVGKPTRITLFQTPYIRTHLSEERNGKKLQLYIWTHVSPEIGTYYIVGLTFSDSERERLFIEEVISGIQANEPSEPLPPLTGP